MSEITVRQIVEEYLREHGYDGLCELNEHCGCGLADLMPCGYTEGHCVAAHKAPCDEDPEDCEWGLVPHTHYYAGPRPKKPNHDGGSLFDPKRPKEGSGE